MSDEQVPQERLSWREATYRFPPLRNAIVAAVLTASAVVAGWLGSPDRVSLVLFFAAIPIGGFYFVREGFGELVAEREVGIEILVLVAALGAMAFGLFEEAAALVVLYASAEAVEELTFARTRSAIRKLLDLAPKQATLLRYGREELVPVEELAPGDVFLVRPGEAIATDGVIRSGQRR